MWFESRCGRWEAAVTGASRHQIYGAQQCWLAVGRGERSAPSCGLARPGAFFCLDKGQQEAGHVGRSLRV